MTEQECLGIDCAWCADPNCPRERRNMKTEKKVTRLLENISKARDILDTGDFKKVRNNLYFFETLRNDIVRQARKYIEHESHELDFNCEDVRAVSDGLLDLENKLIKNSYSQLYKRICKNKPIEMKHFNKLCYEVHDKIYFDRFIRPIADDLAFWALTIFLWAESEYKKDFMEQITAHLKSFL